MSYYLLLPLRVLLLRGNSSAANAWAMGAFFLVGAFVDDWLFIAGATSLCSSVGVGPLRVRGPFTSRASGCGITTSGDCTVNTSVELDDSEGGKEMTGCGEPAGSGPIGASLGVVDIESPLLLIDESCSGVSESSMTDGNERGLDVAVESASIRRVPD